MSSTNIYDPISEALGLKPMQIDYNIMPESESIPNSGIFNPFYGKTHTEETKKVFSKQRRGKKNGMHGRSAISEQNLRWYNNGEENIYVSEGTEPKGFVPGRFNLKRKPHTKETKKRISESLVGKNTNKNRQKTVLSPSGKVYASIKEAAKSCDLTASQFRHRKVKNGDWIIQ